MQEKEQTRLNKLCSRKENNAQRSYTPEPDEIQANEQYRRYDTDKPPSVEEEEEPDEATRTKELLKVEKKLRL